ncbi:uncharacterized protein LOC143354402 [Halictus rubicundus]|uniref:uncharacterized protein LOC143354402 n=1 Tax=Halictus rubicundus TaxID=77578 RepID=UPI0040368DED
MIPKSSLDSANISLGRYRSLDTLMTDDKDATPKIENVGSKSQEDMDVDDAVQIEPIVDEKKHISLSSPAIHVNKITRSDTFIREQEKAKANAEQAESSTIIENEPSLCELQRILKKIDELRECAANLVSRIDDVKKDVCPQSTMPIRRLSSIGGFPGLGRPSTLIRPIPSSKMRRSTSGIPGTPTSSKLSSMLKAEKITSSTRRTTVVTSSERSPNRALRNRSPSVTPIIIKKSPCTTKNPKYAHVQSTIPKPTSLKRKAQ